jgi:hypothetical protein
MSTVPSFASAATAGRAVKERSNSSDGKSAFFIG